MAADQPMAIKMRVAVNGSWLKKILATERFEKTSVPRSPRKTLVKKVNNCTAKGLSNPMRAARSAFISGVARGPNTTLKGSPGTA